jgi:hypothetical protein
MSSKKYHPSLMIMAKNMGFGYLDTTDVLKVDNRGSATAGLVEAGPKKQREPPPPPPEVERHLMQTLDELVPLKGGPRKALKPSQRKWAYHDAGEKNLEVVWDACTNKDIEEFSDWYKKANDDCVKLTVELKPYIDKLNPPDPLRMVIGVVAATSQGTVWEDNISLASDVIKSVIDPTQFKVKKKKQDTDFAESALYITPDNLEKVKKILSGDFTTLQTDKFGAFFASIENPSLTENTVVVDTHAAGIWLGKRLGVKDPEFTRNRPSDVRLGKVVVDYRNLAKKVGYTPQSVQAITWSVWRRFPPQFKADYMFYDGGKHPEVEMFQLLYPYLWATKDDPGPGARDKKRNWRWDFTKFFDKSRPEEMPYNEWKLLQKRSKSAEELERMMSPDEIEALVPHITPQEFAANVAQYGTDLWKFYGFPKNSWDAFLVDYPDFAEKLREIKNASVAAMFDCVADRIWTPR